MKPEVQNQLRNDHVATVENTAKHNADHAKALQERRQERDDRFRNATVGTKNNPRSGK